MGSAMTLEPQRWTPSLLSGYHRRGEVGRWMTINSWRRTKIELPELPHLETGCAITPLMRDVSQVSAIWWERTKGYATEL